MEPQQPQIIEPETTPQQPPKRFWSTSKIIIVAVVASLIVIAGIVVATVMFFNQGGEKKNDPSMGLDPTLYYMRDGYDIQEYGPTIGDPLALTMDKLDRTFKSATGPVVYACNVVSMAELNAQKTYLAARFDPKAISRTFIDGKGEEGVETSRYTLPSGNEDNRCQYGLQSGGLFSISVYQPPFTANEAIKGELEKYYTKADTIGGLATYKYNRDSKSTTTYMIVSGNDAAQVLFNGTKLSDEAQKSLLATAAKNLADQQANPKGPALPVYDSPTYKKAYARACDFISNDDIKALTGSNASIFATEGLASGTGIAKVGEKFYNSIETTCERFNTGLGSGLTPGAFDQKLEVSMTSFNEDAAAKDSIQSAAKGVDNKTDATIGDEGFGYRDTAGQNAVLFRQGRFVVQLMFNRTVQRNAGLEDTTAMTQKLAPYAQQVATKLKSME